MKAKNTTLFKVTAALAILGALGIIAVRMALHSAITGTNTAAVMEVYRVITIKFDIYLLMTFLPILMVEFLFIRMMKKNPEMSESLQKTIMIAVSSAGVFNLIYAFMYANNNAIDAFDWSGYLFLLAVCETLTLPLVLGYKSKYLPEKETPEEIDFHF